MTKLKKKSGWLVVVLALMVGCSQSGSVPTGTTTAEGTPDATYLMASAPMNVQGVGAALKAEGGEEQITVEGRIGGSTEPFVADLAAFTIVDYSIPHCSKEEGCRTPWDYCCETDKLKGNTALVKIVGTDGHPVPKDARALLGVKELSKVVVRGKAKRDGEGNLTILAEKVHIAQE